MKTTIEISDPLFESAKALAARDGVTLRALVEQGLRAIVEERAKEQTFELRDAAVDGRGLQSGAKGLSWDRIRDLAYGEPES